MKTIDKLWNQVNNAEITHTATQEEFNDFLSKAWSGDSAEYRKMPNAIKVATLNQELVQALGLKSGDTYLTKSQAIHTRESRKSQYNQDISQEEFRQLPYALSHAKEAYIQDDNRFLIPFGHKDDKVNLVVLETDAKGNLIITSKKVELANTNKYTKVEAVGLAPTIPQSQNNSVPNTTLLASTSTETNSTQNQQITQEETDGEDMGGSRHRKKLR